MLPLPTRALNKAELRSLLLAIVQAPVGTPLATLTGQIGLTPAAVRNAQQWAQATGLLDERGLTPEGELVAKKDPYLESTVTDWLMHVNLSWSDRSLWAYFIHEFSPKHSTFTQDELLSLCREIFNLEQPDKLLKTVRLILKTYTEPQALAKSKFLTQEKKLYLTGSPDLSNPHTTGYLLAQIWERDFKLQSTVWVDQIIDSKVGLISVLGIDIDKLRQQLDILAQHKIIEQRSIKPHIVGMNPQPKQEGTVTHQVYRCWNTATELLEQAYDNDAITPNKPLTQSLEAILDDDDNIPDLSQFLEWASELVALDGGANKMISLAS
jgi:Protein of unknown function (DUF4007)